MDDEKKGNYGLTLSDDLITGNDEIDEQHKALFKLTNDLINSTEKDKSKKKIGEMLIFLANYAVDHFLHEEKLMLETNFPGYEDHKKMHSDFKYTVIDLIDDFNEQGTSNRLAQSIDGIVVVWLLTHIQHEDKKIAEHINNKTTNNK